MILYEFLRKATIIIIELFRIYIYIDDDDHDGKMKVPISLED